MSSNPNREQFERHMDAGNNAAWSKNWQAAIDEYGRAVSLIPEEPDAHINLGLALMETQQFDRAFKAFKRASQLSPDDPVPVERTADVLERMGQLQEAAQQYVRVSEVYLAQRDLDKAIGNWERATQLSPGLIAVHARLAQAYERIGDSKKAIREYLTLAFNFKRMNDVPKAVRSVERALRLEPKNPQALNTLRALKSGGEVILPEEYLQRKPTATKATKDQPAETFWSEFDEDPSIAEADPRGPIGEAIEHALELLAAAVVEAGLSNYVMAAMRGMEAQRQEDFDEAIDAYLDAIDAGLTDSSLYMLLGGLLTLNEEPDEALKHLRFAAMQPELAAGAYHAMGLCHYLKGDQGQAARYLIESLQAVDKSLAMGPEEIDELTAVYEKLLAALEGRTSESLSKVNERFVGLLSGGDWKQRIAETRRHLDETLRGEGSSGLFELLVAKGADELTDSVSMIDRYIRTGLYTVAMDEAHRAIEISPYYLPIHVRMAEIMMKEGRIRQAINKYNMIAHAYRVRDEFDRAASILAEVLEMAPLDVDVRLNLVELLDSQNRMEESLDQRISLATTYQQLGDFEKAGQMFSNAERIARQVNASSDKMVEIKHHIADIAQMRLNTRQAQKLYEDILAMAPQDEKALRNLVEIYFSQGNPVEAVNKLDVLLGQYAKNSMITRIVQVLQELIRSNPSEAALRARLASIFKKMGRKAEAIEQLDALGEIQLEAGMTRDAANTIRQIIGLNPDRVDDYKRLLQQLNG